MRVVTELAEGAVVGDPQERLLRAASRVSSILLFGVLPFVLVLAILTTGFVRGPFLYDFRGGLYQAGRDIVHGRDPYRPGYLQRQAAVKQAGGRAETVISVPVYPAPTLLASVPFSLLPYRLAGVLFSVLSIGGLLGALHLLGVRDWRCYGAAFVSWPVLHGLMLGALTPLLVLGAAAAWRFRAKVLAPAAAIASLVAAKLFPWPLALWLLLTRRYRAFAASVAIGVVGTLAAWAAIGFAGLLEYPRMLGNLADVSESVGVSPVAGLLALGLPVAAAKIVSLVLAGGLLLAARLADERRAFGLAVVAALIASPMVWPHYLVLLLVPIALLSPRLSALWFLPLLAYAAPVAQTTGRPWAILPYLAIEAVVVWRLCSTRSVVRASVHRHDLGRGLRADASSA